jgi:hypothetical protein
VGRGERVSQEDRIGQEEERHRAESQRLQAAPAQERQRAQDQDLVEEENAPEPRDSGDGAPVGAERGREEVDPGGHRQGARQEGQLF